MNVLKGAALAIVLAATTTVSAVAQQQKPEGQPKEKEPRTQEQMVEKMSEAMAKKLELSEAQAKDLYAINLKYLEQKKQDREELKQMEVAKVKELISILNEDQLADYILTLQNKGKQGQRGGQRGPQMGQGQRGGQQGPQMRPQGQGRGQQGQNPEMKEGEGQPQGPRGPQGRPERAGEQAPANE